MSPVERDQIVGLDLDCGDQDRHVRLVGDQIAPCGDFRGGWILDDSYMAGAQRLSIERQRSRRLARRRPFVLSDDLRRNSNRDDAGLAELQQGARCADGRDHASEKTLISKKSCGRRGSVSDIVLAIVAFTLFVEALYHLLNRDACGLQDLCYLIAQGRDA